MTRLSPGSCLRPASVGLLLALFLLISQVSHAQQTSPHTADATDQLSQLIYTGKQLEVEGRWGEALNHYQRALKVLPENQQIRTRRSISRIHYDLNRRYADSKYVETLANIGSTRALNLYAEVLLKIQSYYVIQPNWDNILRHGLASMEIALSDASFVRMNLPNVEQNRIQPAIDRMNAVLKRYQVSSRQDAYVVASNVCRNLQQDLGLPLQTSVYEFTSGAIIALDPYSAFMTSNQYGETMSQIEGNFVGLGVELKTHPDHLEIVNVIAGGPAGRAGMRSGDRLVAIENESVESMGSDVAADALRGVEGSYINVTVIRENGRQAPLRMQRRRVEIPSVEDVAIIDPESGIGYLKLSNFQKTTARDFDAALWQLQRQGMRSLIVDVRGNPGGLLNSAVDISDRFISNGVIVSTKGRNPLEDYVHRAKTAGTWRVPLVVLIDENSASASEIFAAAIADHQRGTVVGTQSYGKGSVQGIFPLNVGGGGVRLTTAKFYSPDGSPISQIGVSPAVPVQSTARPVADDQQAEPGDQTDDILRVGVSVARRSLGQQQYAGN
ncbi:MAG: S41 family peptidase [Pirellulaceae bacterium]